MFLRIDAEAERILGLDDPGLLGEQGWTRSGTGYDMTLGQLRSLLSWAIDAGENLSDVSADERRALARLSRRIERLLAKGGE